jgi:hypothetical protein
MTATSQIVAADGPSEQPGVCCVVLETHAAAVGRA